MNCPPPSPPDAPAPVPMAEVATVVFDGVHRAAAKCAPYKTLEEQMVAMTDEQWEECQRIAKAKGYQPHSIASGCASGPEPDVCCQDYDNCTREDCVTRLRDEIEKTRTCLRTAPAELTWMSAEKIRNMMEAAQEKCWALRAELDAAKCAPAAPATPEPENCAGCRFFRQDPGEYGTCRRGPRNETKLHGDWCGEFRRKEAQHGS